MLERARLDRGPPDPEEIADRVRQVAVRHPTSRAAVAPVRTESPARRSPPESSTDFRHSPPSRPPAFRRSPRCRATRRAAPDPPKAAPRSYPCTPPRAAQRPRRPGIEQGYAPYAPCEGSLGVASPPTYRDRAERLHTWGTAASGRREPCTGTRHAFLSPGAGRDPPRPGVPIGGAGSVSRERDARRRVSRHHATLRERAPVRGDRPPGRRRARGGEHAAVDDAAMRAGATGVEVNLSMTADGEVVLWHDWNPDSTVALARQAGREPHVKYRPRVPDVGSNLRRSVHRLTLEELRRHYGYAAVEDREASGRTHPDLRRVRRLGGEARVAHSRLPRRQDTEGASGARRATPGGHRATPSEQRADRGRVHVAAGSGVEAPARPPARAQRRVRRRPGCHRHRRGDLRGFVRATFA